MKTEHIGSASCIINQQEFKPRVNPFAPVRAGDRIEARAFAHIRRQAVLEGCKWDPQVGDVGTLAPFPLLLRRSVWNQLATWAEQLAEETICAEHEILQRPELLKVLGINAPLRRALRGSDPITPAAARSMRFDFHPTAEGWQVSEVNSDVPGGFTESSFFTDLIAEHVPFACPAGNPAETWASSVASAARRNGTVCLLSAPGFMEDHQIMAYLAKQLRAHGCRTHLANPSQISWRDGRASLDTAWFRGRVDALVRFYQGEWLPRLPRRCGWRHYIRGGCTPVTNPGSAIISESKRLPTIWNQLSTALPTWRRLLPPTRDPCEAPWRTDHDWVLKSAFSNTADHVYIRPVVNERDWRKLEWEVWLSPWKWLAQRRFDSVPVDTPQGPLHACIGVYAINGKAAGAYGRLAPRPLIDYAAIDAAVLIEDDD